MGYGSGELSIGPTDAGNIIADGVKFVMRNSVVSRTVGWHETDRVEIVGQWKQSSSLKGFLGLTYLHDDQRGDGSLSVTFTLSAPVSGSYAVMISYTSDKQRAKEVPVTVTLPGEIVHVVLVDQTVGGGRPFLVGKYDGDAGDITVKISNEGTVGYVIVDLAMIVLLDHSECLCLPA